MASVATRPQVRAPHGSPIGTGELHQALEDARDLARLHDFCRTHVCTAHQVSVDGKRLDMLSVLELMRSRGYQVSQPMRPQQQLRKGSTQWHVNVTLPTGQSVQFAFITSDQK